MPILLEFLDQSEFRFRWVHLWKSLDSDLTISGGTYVRRNTVHLFRMSHIKPSFCITMMEVASGIYYMGKCSIQVKSAVIF